MITTIVLGGFLHDLLRRVHHAVGLRERLPGHHPHRLHGPTGIVPEHENAISYDYPMFSKPMSAADVIAEFS